MTSSVLLSIGPPVMLGVTVIALIAVRSRSARARILVEGLVLLALTAAFAGWGLSPLPSSAQLARSHDELWLRAVAVVWWLVGARFIALMMTLGLGPHVRQARLVSDLAAGAIYVTAALVVLNSVLGLELKGLLATSGLIAILVGLASQNTLSDVFSGIVVGLDQPFRIGDRVSIADQADGVVAQMNWRSIRVQTDDEDIAVIPNSVVAKSRVINHSVPTPRRAASVEISVSSMGAPEPFIEQLRQATLLAPKLLAQPSPTVRLKYLGVRSTTFVVSYFVASSSDLATARSQLLRQVRRVLRYAGLGPDPAPSRTALLGALALFDTLTPDQVARLEPQLIAHRLEPNDRLFEQGGLGGSIYIVASGVLDVFRQEDDVRRPLGRIGPGEYLGEISMMSGKPHPASAVALTVGEVLELPRSALERLLSDDAALGEALELSVKRGLALLDRDDAARNANPLDESGSLLGQIRQFLRRRM